MYEALNGAALNDVTCKRSRLEIQQTGTTILLHVAINHKGCCMVIAIHMFLQHFLPQVIENYLGVPVFTGGLTTFARRAGFDNQYWSGRIDFDSKNGSGTSFCQNRSG